MDSESTDLCLNTMDSKENKYLISENTMNISNELIQCYKEHEVIDKKIENDCFNTFEKIEKEINRKFQNINNIKTSICRSIENLEGVIRGSNFPEKNEKLNQLKSDKEEVENKITLMKAKLKDCQSELEQKSQNVEHLEKLLNKTKKENNLANFDRLFLYRKILKTKITHVDGKLKMYTFDTKNKKIEGIDIDESQNEQLIVRRNLNFLTKY